VSSELESDSPMEALIADFHADASSGLVEQRIQSSPSSFSTVKHVLGSSLAF